MAKQLCSLISPLTYARTLRDGANNVQERLRLDERTHLPILLPLRDFGQHLKESHKDASKDGPGVIVALPARLLRSAIY